MKLDDFIHCENSRKALFPVAENRIFLAHAGVTALPTAATEGIIAYARQGSAHQQENEAVWKETSRLRSQAATLLKAEPAEIALLGPTALGLNLVANGLPWKSGDEVIYYPDDYPANVYPWTKLTALGVKPVALTPEKPGHITWKSIEEKLSPRTRLLSLASANYLSGYRIDIQTIGSRLKQHNPNALFCLDAIQTLGAFPTTTEHIDFLAADSHKWLLGPMGAGIFFVKEHLQETLTPSLLGSWNVYSPDFVAQPDISYYPGARRYEPGSLNFPGNAGMLGSLEMINLLGIETISSRILTLGKQITEGMTSLGFTPYSDHLHEPSLFEDQNNHQTQHNPASGIYSFTHPSKDLSALFERLRKARIDVSLRMNRDSTPILRISPHFYNTPEEISTLLKHLAP